MTDVTTTASRFGLSSGSAPGDTAAQLLARLQRWELGTVDLRFGKGHAWEAGGTTVFTTAGIEIAHIGVSVTLGAVDVDLDALEAGLSRMLDPGRAVPVKVFAGATLDDQGAAGAKAWDLAERQITRLARISGRPPLVETHHGYASIATLGELCQKLGCAVLLDVFGLQRLTGGLSDPDDVLRTWTRAVQVKGFAVDDVGKHLPLSRMPEAAWALLRDLPEPVPVTLESRSGTIGDDITTLKRRYQTAGKETS
ncbi:MAG TPA: hypothetical protein VLL08_03325 [Kineosporiaceae bacterium]|nr:hypothetical protein [Kineosporiaceae bacterium]